jgi:hypothetical protein
LNEKIKLQNISRMEIEGYLLNLEKVAKKMRRKMYDWVLEDDEE